MRLLIMCVMLALSAVASAQDDRQCIRDGNRLYRQKDFANAEVMYRKALARNEGNPQAMYNLGCALMMQEKDSAAVEEFQKSAQHEKSKMRQSKIYHNIGVICQNHRMYDDAIKAYEQSLRCNPGDDETRYNLALCKKMRKNQPDNNQGQNKDQNKDNNKNDDQQQQRQDNNKDQDKKDDKKDKQNQQPQEQMSKENAEQLIEAAIQNEKETQQKLQNAMRQQSSRRIEKNW